MHEADPAGESVAVEQQTSSEVSQTQFCAPIDSDEPVVLFARVQDRHSTSTLRAGHLDQRKRQLRTVVR